MTLIFAYKSPSNSDVPAPYLSLILSDPFEIKKVEITAIIDTGFDGEILIPKSIYDDLKLKSFEYSSDVISQAETASGEFLELISASGSVRIKGSNLLTIITIDSHEKCKEVLIGRKFLESYHTLLKGPERELEITFLQVI